MPYSDHTQPPFCFFFGRGESQANSIKCGKRGRRSPFRAGRGRYIQSKGGKRWASGQAGRYTGHHGGKRGIPHPPPPNRQDGALRAGLGRLAPRYLRAAPTIAAPPLSIVSRRLWCFPGSGGSGALPPSGRHGIVAQGVLERPGSLKFARFPYGVAGKGMALPESGRTISPPSL